MFMLVFFAHIVFDAQETTGEAMSVSPPILRLHAPAHTVHTLC